MKKQFKVFRVSENTNSFGLRGIWIIDKDGHMFEIGTNYLNTPDKGKVVVGTTNEAGDSLLRIAGTSFEIPSYQGKAPKDITSEVWATEFSPNELT